MEIPNPVYERIKTVQKQLRIAVQNHQVLVLKHRVTPSDQDIKNQISFTQGLIISIGRNQAELLSQFRKEMTIEESKLSSPALQKYLVWPDTPKNIPIYKKCQGYIHESKKIANWKPRKEMPLSYVRLPNKLHSLLKVNSEKEKKKKQQLKVTKKFNEEKILVDNSKIKIVYNKGDEASILKNPKRMQSVLKSKNGEKLKCCENCSGCLDCRLDSELADIKPSDGKERKSSPCSSEGTSDECAEIIPIKSRSSRSRSSSVSPKPNQKKYEPKIMTKTKLKNANSSTKKEFKTESDLRVSELSSKNEPPSLLRRRTRRMLVDNSSMSSRPEETCNWLTAEEAGQDGFLGYLGLINKAQFDALKRKRCERKRRSVAGQSSLYNDYFQPPTPKRTYAPRKAQLALGPVCNSGGNNAGQVTVETAEAEEDEDKQAGRLCSVCQLPGGMEVCHSCSDAYHPKCVGRGDSCPSCNAPVSASIRNIVGANTGATASSMELIKRYLRP